MLEVSIEAGKDALDDSINLNPVLKKAGVVDAGGMGYLVIYEAMLASLRGEAAPEAASGPAAGGESSVFEKFDTADITFAYDTVFIVRKTVEKSLETLRAFLDSIGDSLVIGEDDERFKVHVHTNIPGDALTEAQKYGTLETAKIENMRTQHDELVEKAATVQTLAAPEKEYGAVAVCAGKGMADLFREVGADSIVTGGQTMNPSTDDILKEINRTPARTVFVFPNNKNIIMAAEQCVPLTDKEVVVIPTKSVPQGISALLCLEPEESEESIIEAMSEAMDRVHTAQVTYAARDSEFDGQDIHAGEYLALLDGALIGSYTDQSAMLEALCAAFDAHSPDIFTVYYGEDVTQEDAQKTADRISAHFPDAEVSVVNGGQPVYYYMISAE